jgi:RNA polymerase sigma factor (sigma-70 family)
MLNTTNKASTLLTPAIMRELTSTVGHVLNVTHAHDVADCVQAAIVRILSALETFDEEKAPFRVWSRTIAANVAKNWRALKANGGNHESEIEVSDEGDTDTLVDTLEGSDGREVVARRFEMSALARAVATLDDDARAFLSAINDGMGQTEAGTLLGWSPATSTRRYRAIVATLAERMGA